MSSEAIENTTTAPKTSAVVSLVAGLASLVFLIIYFVTTLGATFLIITLILAIAGVVFGIVALKLRQPRGMALTGLIVGAIVALVAIAIFVFALIFIGAFLA